MPSSHAGPDSPEPPSLLAAPLWSAGSLIFSVTDLTRVASHLGWLQAEVRALARRDHVRESAPPADEDVQRASDSFRYEHELITAEEAEQWLEARGLSAEDFQVYCERRAVAETGAEAEIEEAESGSAGAAIDPEDLRCHLWFSGEMARLARRAAWLLIAARQAGETTPEDGPDLDTWSRWATLLARQRNELLGGVEAKRLLEARRWPLTRVALEVTSFPDEATAREAELCLNEGSASMDEIVAGSGASRECVDGLVDELATELQEEVLTLPPGAVRRLEKPDQPPRLIRVLARTEPRADDPVVAGRVAGWLLEDRYGDLERSLVTWEHPALRLT